MNTPHARQCGFSVIELMVALTIGLLIIAAMLQNLTVASGSNRTNARVAEFQGNGRFAADFLRREIQHSGFAGIIGSKPVPPSPITAPYTANYGCGAGFAAKIDEPIAGANDSNPFSGSCIPSANYARGDILVLRRAGLDAIPTAELAANTLYLRSDYAQAEVFDLANPLGCPATTAKCWQSPAVNYKVATDVYYISKWTNSAAESPQVPALYRMTLGTGPLMMGQLVASNIENMQVQYGVATTTGVRFYDADDVPASLWTNVVAVRLWLLARSTTAESGYSNTSSYAMGNESVTAADGYQRQVFPLVVQIRKCGAAWTSSNTECW